MLSFERIIEDVFDQLKEAVGSDGYWTENEVKDALNDAYLEIADELMCFTRDAIIEVFSGERIYKLPEDHIIGSLRRVEYDEEKIYPVTVAELDSYDKNWRSKTGDPTHYILDLYGPDEIALYPEPDTTGSEYNLASESKDRGVVTTVENDSYEEFNSEEGVIVDSSGEARFDSSFGTGPVQAIETPTGNLHIFDSKYPKRLESNNEVFLPPITYNPRRILTKGALATLLAKECQGKDIVKSTYHRNSFLKAIEKLDRPRTKRLHRMRSISEGSTGHEMRRGDVYLGAHYPSYYFRRG